VAWQCKIGFHKWEWTYDHPATSCVQTGRCQRPNCQQTKTQTVHRFGSWEYVSATSCDQVQKCICGEVQQRTDIHIWGDPEYILEHNCTRVSTCKRNASHTKSSVDHIWGQPTTLPDCEVVSYCTRCPDGINRLGVRHDLLPAERVTVMEDGSYKTMVLRRCRNCKYTETDELEEAG
jgi:hypothetical protein